MINNNLLRSGDNTLSLCDNDNIFKQSPNPFADDYNHNIFNSPNINQFKTDPIDTALSSFNLYKRPNLTEEENQMMSTFNMKRNDSFDLSDVFKSSYNKEYESNNDNPMSHEESYFSISSVEKDRK